jgi:hypothetical protein
MNARVSSCHNIRCLALRKALCLALGIALLPCAALGQVMQNQSDDLKTSIARVQAGSFSNSDLETVARAGAGNIFWVWPCDREMAWQGCGLSFRFSRRLFTPHPSEGRVFPQPARWCLQFYENGQMNYMLLVTCTAAFAGWLPGRAPKAIDTEICEFLSDQQRL